MTPADSPFCDYLPWDTEFFGFRIGRVRSDTLDGEQASEIDRWAQENQIRGLYFLSRADDPATIRTAETHGFSLVDIRLTLASSSLNPQPYPQGQSETLIRPAQPDDLAELQSIARSAYQDARFFNDPHFPRERAEALYSTWITRECQGRAQRVLVAASRQNQPLGYVSCHLDSSVGAGQIGLVGVSAEFRGNGLGKTLVLSSLDWFTEQGAKKIIVVTQGSNRSAQRLYQRCGFLTEEVQLWYHKWYPTPGNGHA